MEAEQAKFILTNNITIEEYINNKINEKLEKIIYQINCNFSQHNHNIMTNNYNNQVTMSILASNNIMEIKKGIHY